MVYNNSVCVIPREHTVEIVGVFRFLVLPNNSKQGIYTQEQHLNIYHTFYKTMLHFLSQGFILHEKIKQIIG